MLTDCTVNDDDYLLTRICETPGCGLAAKLQCPTCIKLGILKSYFCGQQCFKGYWEQHKVLHKLARSGPGADSCGFVDQFPDYKYTGNVRAWPRSPLRTVPPHIARPDYADHPQGNSVSEQDAKKSAQIKVLDEEEIQGLRVACRLARECLDEAAKAVAIGVSTDELDRVVHEAAVERECYPSPLHYYMFPKSCCTSVNEVICHGIPDLRPLQDGDLVNVDVTVYHRGFHGDLNETFFVGEVDEESKRLVRVTYECLQQAIAICKPGVKYREIGNVIQKHAVANGCSVVRSYCGHGIHRLFHTTPSVPHYAKNKAIGVMKVGNAFTIEPMINQGHWSDLEWPDHWTAVTEDGKRSAQFEQTLLVTETGVDVLTARREHDGRPWFMDSLASPS